MSPTQWAIMALTLLFSSFLLGMAVLTIILGRDESVGGFIIFASLGMACGGGAIVAYRSK